LGIFYKKITHIEGRCGPVEQLNEYEIVKMIREKVQVGGGSKRFGANRWKFGGRLGRSAPKGLGKSVCVKKATRVVEPSG
jgi:hypothetical protein